MIETFLVSELNTIPELNGQCYPVAAPVGDLNPPFCIYTRTGGRVIRDLSGEPVYSEAEYRLDLFGEDTDALFALERKMIQALSKISVPFGDLYIYSAEATPGEPDGFDLTIETTMRSISYKVTYWG